MTMAPNPLLTMPHQGRRMLWMALVGVVVVLPWINPFSSGPRANAIPLLVSGFCTLALLLGFWLLPHGAPRNPCQPTAVLAAWLAAALLSSAMGLLQYGGLADAFSPWINYTPMGQAFGNLRQRNQFASLMSIGFVAVLYLARRFSPAPGTHPALRWTLVGAALALLALANAASASRTGAMQWLLVAALCLLPQQRRSRALAWLAVLLYALAVFLLPALLEWVTGLPQTGLIQRFGESTGCESRRVLWANVMELIAEQPWRGWGWGELKYAHFNHPYTGERFCAILDNAHNLPLHLAVELGVPLATTLCAAVLWWVWRNQPWNDTDARRQAAWMVLAIIALHSLVEYPLWYGPFQMTVGLCLWLLWRRPAPVADADATRRTIPTLLQPIAALAATLACALLFYTTWDYTRVSQLYLPKEQRLTAYQDDTLAKARPSRLFAREVQFAELSTMALNADTAPRHYTLARQLLHFSPEPRVLQTLLDSAQWLGLDDVSLRTTRQQFAAAYPQAFAQWMQKESP